MKTSKKPLIILSLQFYCFPDEMGGAWKLTYEVNKRLVEKGHTVLQLTCKPDDSLTDFEIIDGIEYYRIGSQESKGLISLIRAVSQIYDEMIKKYKIDLIHIHNPLVDFVCLFNPKLWKIPRIYHFHSLWFDEERINLLGFKNYLNVSLFDFKLCFRLSIIAIIEWTCFVFAKRFVFLSSYTKSRFKSFFPFKKKKLSVIPGGVDLKAFRPGAAGLSQKDCRLRLGIPVETNVFLTVRRLESRMGLKNLIEAFRIISQKDSERKFYLMIVGRGSLQETLQKQIDECGMTAQIKLAGRVPDEEIAYYYGAADLFVLPTLAIEGFGLATVEALASGLPVFGTPVGGTTEILENIDPRLVFNNSSPEAMAELIQDFLKNPDPILALKKRCRDEAEKKYDWGLSVNLLEKMFYEALEGKVLVR